MRPFQVLPISPRPPFLNHLAVDVLKTVSQNSDYPPMPVHIHHFQSHRLAQKLSLQSLLSLFTEGLARFPAVWDFWRVNAEQPDSELGPLRREDRNRITIRNLVNHTAQGSVCWKVGNSEKQDEKDG